MRATGAPISRRISASTAVRSSPTSRTTRSLRTCSRLLMGTGKERLLDDDAVLDPDFGTLRERLDLRHGKLVAYLRHPGGGDLVVELAEALASDGMHDRNAVTTQADDGAWLHSVLRG